MRTFVFLLALLLPAPALAAGTWTNQGAAACTAADYDAIVALPAPADETTCQALDTGEVHQYCAVTGYWQPPGTCPAALIVDNDGSVLPASDTPAWTDHGAATPISTAGGVITISDTSGTQYIRTYLTDAANFDGTHNIGYIVRLRVTAQDAGPHPPASYMCLRVDAGPGGCFSFVAWVSLSAPGNFCPIDGNLAMLKANPDQSPDNAAWNTYYIFYDAAKHEYRSGVLGREYYRFNRAIVGNWTYVTEKTIVIGSYSPGGEATTEIDSMKVFVY